MLAQQQQLTKGEIDPKTNKKLARKISAFLLGRIFS